MSLSCIIFSIVFCCDVCEVCQPALGLNRRTSHTSIYLFILFYCDMCEVCRLAPGVRRWVSHTMYVILLLYKLWCVWGLPTCSWAASVGLSCIIFVIVLCCDVCGVSCVGVPFIHNFVIVYIVVCVRSADLLLGYVGGLSHIILLFWCLIVF